MPEELRLGLPGTVMLAIIGIERRGLESKGRLVRVKLEDNGTYRMLLDNFSHHGNSNLRFQTVKNHPPAGRARGGWCMPALKRERRNYIAIMGRDTIPGSV